MASAGAIPERLRLERLWHGLGLLGVGVVIYFSLASEPAMRLTAWVSWGDKLEHGLGYGLLMAWYAQLYPTGRGRLGAAAGLIGLAVGLEILQGFVDYRTPDVGDGLASAGGVVLAALLVRGAGTRLLHRLERVWLG